MSLPATGGRLERAPEGRSGSGSGHVGADPGPRPPGRHGAGRRAARQSCATSSTRQSPRRARPGGGQPWVDHGHGGQVAARCDRARRDPPGMARRSPPCWTGGRGSGSGWHPARHAGNGRALTSRGDHVYSGLGSCGVQVSQVAWRLCCGITDEVVTGAPRSGGAFVISGFGSSRNPGECMERGNDPAPVLAGLSTAVRRRVGGLTRRTRVPVPRFGT